MSIVDTGNRSEQERQAMQVAEDAREEAWNHRSFSEELFAGSFNFNLIFPFPEQDEADKKIGDEYVKQVLDFLTENHDPSYVDQHKIIPEKTVKGLGELGYFGIKIPTEYGGLGLSQTNYNRIIHAVGSYCASTAVLLSAHQSIGVPQPLKVFGTPEQKKKFLPRLAKGEISAFALTEPDVGSDPAQMKTTAMPTEDGEHYIINGTKLWCTNGPIADMVVVMALTPPKQMPDGREKKQISAFIVEANTPGFEVLHRCDFMGLKGIQNGLIKFTNVKVPKENLLWGEGKGLKLALITLNTGRLTLPAAVTGAARVCFQTAKQWSSERNQWGAAIGEHEASAYRLLISAGGTYALDAVGKLTSGLADRGAADIRIEASVAKLFSTGLSWRIIDNTLQLRGGRGYETAESLAARGEDGYPIERLMRDSRINSIIEGTSNIQRLFVSREALDRHLKIAGALFSPKTGVGEKLSAIGKAATFYSWWYPLLWIKPILSKFKYWNYGWAGGYLRYVDAMSAKLAKTMFHAMALNGPALEKKQITLGRIVDTGANLFVMAAVISRFLTREKNNQLNRQEHIIAKRVCESFKQASNSSYRKINVWPGQSAVLSLSKAIMNGELDWLNEDTVDVVAMAKRSKKQMPTSGKDSASFKEELRKAEAS